ncbi:MAG TPA: phosphoribosylanthranilate isomerase [Candidatus Eisenbacteria bacterium]|nr:phosphoribosylanthranilate isomerase [Candidatus Eisenbacteria bacterium]
MMGPFVKVCGITRQNDALAAVAAGAHAIGFVFVPGSPRAINPETARAIGGELPSHVARVGVVRDLGASELEALVSSAKLTALQLHGNESPELCARLSVRAVKAFAAGRGFDVQVLTPFRDVPVLLDGGTQTGEGGTGQTADWEVARAAREHGFHVLLAGGLGPQNVEQAVLDVRPVAVDLNSAVEIAPGVKDPRLITDALRALARFDLPEVTTWPW